MCRWKVSENETEAPEKRQTDTLNVSEIRINIDIEGMRADFARCDDNSTSFTLS